MKNTIITILIILFLFGTILSVFVLIKFRTSEPFLVSKEFIENNEIIKQELGSIQGYGLFVTGSVDENRSGIGNASLNFDVEGKIDNANIQIDLATDSTGNWKVLIIP